MSTRTSSRRIEKEETYMVVDERAGNGVANIVLLSDTLVHEGKRVGCISPSRPGALPLGSISSKLHTPHMPVSLFFLLLYIV